MICFQISIFEPLETTYISSEEYCHWLWFAFKLVSLNHWKQRIRIYLKERPVVICFQISIFEPLETTHEGRNRERMQLWFAFKLVSLNHWKQLRYLSRLGLSVVICFQISIFEPLETTVVENSSIVAKLWFAFKLVSLNHWKQQTDDGTKYFKVVICFQISIFEPLETTYVMDKSSLLRCDLLSN